jgi:hypothetical protein
MEVGCRKQNKMQRVLHFIFLFSVLYFLFSFFIRAGADEAGQDPVFKTPVLADDPDMCNAYA